MRASVVSRRSRVTRTSSAPRPLMRAGEHLVARRLVDRQRLAGDRRLVDRARARRRPRRRAESSRPGLTTMTAPSATCSTVDAPLAAARRAPAPRPASGPSARGPRAARARACAPRASARRANRKTTAAASDHWPSAIAPAAATSISTLMSSERERAARATPCASGERHAGGDRRRAKHAARAATARRAQLGSEAGRRARRPTPRPAARRAPRGVVADRDRLLVLEPRAHAGVGDGVGDRRRRQLRGVVLHVQALAHEVGGEVLEARQVLEPPLDERHFLAAVHALDLEGRLGVQLADGAGRHALAAAAPPAAGSRRRAPSARSSHVLEPLLEQPTMCWSSSA